MKTNVAVKAETPEQALARVLAENAALTAQISAMDQADVVKAGAFELSVTVARAVGTKDKNDKGSKGGSLSISLGKQHIYPSRAMVLAIFAHEDEIREFLTASGTAITR